MTETRMGLSYFAGAATVVFDPSVTNTDAIVTASTNAGYRASVKR